jgi:ATP-dependent helicase/nuclease subunit A
MSEPIALPRELVLASAGTGKTFRISSRIIGLLAAGAPVESIFASTFTRKAAGEILDRVLARIADAVLDDGAARLLAQEVALADGHRVEGTRDFWMELLEGLVRQLHRVNIGTLDSFFVRTALSFGDEISLPPAWAIADVATEARIRSAALQDVLADADRAVVVELIRGVTSADAGRSVHDALLRRARQLLDLHHALEDRGDEPWTAFDRVLGERPLEFRERQQRLAQRLASVEPPVTKGGTPDRVWQNALFRCADLIAEGDWNALVKHGLCAAAQADGEKFSRREVPAEICGIFREALELARYELGTRLAQQSRALGRLAHLLASAVERKQREMGAYGFSDVTRLIGGPDPLGKRQDLYYRLDARTEHILLDEFQDTSLTQWEALEPLLDELLSGHEGERAAVVVADPKQSIYAWRGGEPLLVRHVGERYALDGEELHLSYRSSQVVLDVANRIFHDLAANAVFSDDEVAAGVAADWGRDFTAHRAARDLPGHVRLVVGPEDEGTGADRPNLCRRAAQLVGRLRDEAPGMSIGVLTRRNRTVAQVMLELRHLGVPASEEGGNPLTDSAAVASVLALLRLADHPGDRIARYHVAMTPIGEVEGYTDAEDPAGARKLAHDVRRRLVEDGYGITLERISRRMERFCSAREKRRFTQLVELAYRFDSQATLRSSDFLALVSEERVEDPTTADVRVMTVHQAKGLEFDIVVLPELDTSLAGRDAELLAYRPEPAGRITHAFPYVNEAVRKLFPELPELRMAAEQARAGRLRDGLSSLYVAVTRAKYALHLIIKPDGARGMSQSMSGSPLIRHALDATGPAVEGTVLFEYGDPHWHEKMLQLRREVESDRLVGSAKPGAIGKPGKVAMRSSDGRRIFARRTPSELAGGSKVDLRMMLSLDPRAADEGTLIHAWLEQLSWMEDGLPGDDDLFAIARSNQPAISPERVATLITRLRDSLNEPAVRRALSRESYPTSTEVEREVPFAHREEGALIEGVIDRLLIFRTNGVVNGTAILDYKTDALAGDYRRALDEKITHYRPQMHAYRRAVAAAFRIPESAVSCQLVLLEAGEVREV